MAATTSMSPGLNSLTLVGFELDGLNGGQLKGATIARLPDASRLPSTSIGCFGSCLDTSMILLTYFGSNSAKLTEIASIIKTKTV